MTRTGFPPIASPGGLALARVRYAPGVQALYNLTNTLAAVDTTYLTIPFTAPASGNVRVRAVIYGRVAVTETVTDEGYLVMAFMNHTGGAQVSAMHRFCDLICNVTGAQLYTGGMCTYEDIVTGLTPGAAYQYDLGGNYGGTAAAFQAILVANAGGTAGTADIGPATLEVYAA
jgi:hypothetical protein